MCVVVGDVFQVTSIKWERVLLTLDVDVPSEDDYSFELRASSGLDDTAFPISAERVKPGQYRLSMNVTTFGGRQQIPNGSWHLIALTGGIERIAGFNLARVRELDDCSRAFVYNGGYSSYVVSFAISSDEECPVLLMRTYAFGRSRRAPQRLRDRLRAKPRKWWKKRKRSVLRGVFRAGLLFRKKDGDRILFASEQRPNMQGNLKAVHDRMVERGLDKEFEFRYSFRTHLSTSRSSAFDLAWKLGRADIVLIDDYFPILMDLSDTSKQRVIQLWHAGSGFKSIGYSRFGQHGSPHLTNSHRLYNYGIAGSQHLRDVYSEAFGIDREAVFATGLPRIDAFLREGREAEVRPVFEAAYPAAVGKRTVLFAPTFRGNGVGDAHYPYEKLDFQALYDACGEDTVILFRQHHFIAEPVPIPPQMQDRLIDVGAFPDTNDLLLVSDVLITDYSSIIYEYSLLRRPMLFFAFDVDVYSAVRGMHREYDEIAPGPIATDFGQLVDLIKTPDLSIEKTEAFLAENFDYIDTNNSDRVIDWLVLSDPQNRSDGTSR